LDREKGRAEKEQYGAERPKCLHEEWEAKIGPNRGSRGLRSSEGDKSQGHQRVEHYAYHALLKAITLCPNRAERPATPDDLPDGGTWETKKRCEDPNEERFSDRLSEKAPYEVA